MATADRAGVDIWGVAIDQGAWIFRDRKQYRLRGYDSYSVARSVDTADKVLGFKLSEAVFHGPADRLTLTQNAQPAILAVALRAQEANPRAEAGYGGRVQSGWVTRPCLAWVAGF